MYSWLKISHRTHSGRLRPHEHTSYGPLAALLVVVGIALSACSVPVLSADHPAPQSGSIGLTGEMPAKAPTVAAAITTPKHQQHISESPITISGTCPANTLVELYKNDIFAGAGTCSSSGSFSFQIDLLIGQNNLVARVYDDLNQPGPDSKTVTVWYDALPPQAAGLSPLNFTGNQLLLNTTAVFRGSFPGQALSIPINIIGGVPPYAVNVEWGDSKNDIVPRNDNLTFNTTHTYRKAGTYQITLHATDMQGRVAFLTVAAIVNGQPDAATTTSPVKNATNKLLVLWPLYTSMLAMVVSFWLGERREKHLLSGPVYH